MEKWRNINEIKPLVFLLLKQVDIIKKFYQFNETDNGVIAVAGPTIWEITQLYKRLSKGILKENTLKKISMMVRNHNYSLYNAIYLYKKIISEIGENYREDEFYNCIKEKLRSIEEDVSWDDIHIDSTIKEKLMKKFETFLNGGGGIKKGSKGFILAGPPGTGKTMIAKALANMGGFYFMPVKLADLKGEYLGHSGKNLQRTFEIARANAPTLIFIDEADAVFPIRINAPIRDAYVLEMTNQFLAEIDGVDTGKQDIFVLLATNRDDIIDPAVKSRLETIYIGLPSKIARVKILQNFLPDFKDEELCEYFMENSEGLSGRDIKNLAEEIRVLKEKYGNYKDALEKAFLNSISKTIYKASNLLNIKFDNSKDKPFLDKVVFFKRLKERLFRILQILTNKEIYIKYGLKPLNGCLIYGPEGNGKSLLAELVAVELGLKRIILECQMLSGISSNVHFNDLISDIIKIASLNKIMFLLKDIDKLLSRGFFEVEDENYFLRKNLMILKEHKNIILVATTDSDIDIQKMLPNVFDREISLGISNDEVDDVELSSIFNSLLNNDKFVTDEKTISEQIKYFRERVTDHLSLKISDIIKLCDKAKYNAVFRLKNNFEKKIVITDIDFI